MILGRVIEPAALERIREIHRTSARYNKMIGYDHQQRLLELMRKHVDEIQVLATQKDAHYLIETGDLLILCYELLLEGGGSIDGISEVCFGRYEKKLKELIDAAR